MTRPDEQDEPASRRAQRTSLPSRRGWLWIMVSVIVLAGLALTVARFTATSDPRLTASGNPGPGALSTRPTGSSTPAGGVLTPNAAPATSHTSVAQPRNAEDLRLAAGAVPLPNKVRGQVAAWDSGPGGATLAVVSTQLGNATQAAAARQYYEMKTACTALAVGVRTAQTGPPIPEAAMQALYVKALTYLSAGAEECQKAISEQADGEEPALTHENTALLQQSQTALGAGAKKLFQATAEIKALRSR